MIYTKMLDFLKSLSTEKNIFIHVPFSGSLFLVDNYLYVDPKSNSIRYYKETDINYYTRIRKENHKHVHQEPYSFERISTGMYFGNFISSYEYNSECCFITIDILYGTFL